MLLKQVHEKVHDLMTKCTNCVTHNIEIEEHFLVSCTYYRINS